jgi:hypothetical protein
MAQIIKAHFDGKVIVPDEPVEFPIGQALRVVLEAEKPPSDFSDFLNFAVDLPDAPTDLAAQHDHYLYGSPKR